MRKIFLLLFSMVLISGSAKVKKKVVVETWPDNTVMDAWFKDTTKAAVATLGRQYVITDYGVKNDSNIVQTSAIQAVAICCSPGLIQGDTMTAPFLPDSRKYCFRCSISS